MLAISRGNNEEIVIKARDGRELIRIVVKTEDQQTAVICFDADPSIQILREELIGAPLEEQHRRNQRGRETKTYVRL